MRKTCTSCPTEARRSASAVIAVPIPPVRRRPSRSLVTSAIRPPGALSARRSSMAAVPSAGGRACGILSSEEARPRACFAQPDPDLQFDRASALQDGRRATFRARSQGSQSFRRKPLIMRVEPALVGVLLFLVPLLLSGFAPRARNRAEKPVSPLEMVQHAADRNVHRGAAIARVVVSLCEPERWPDADKRILALPNGMLRRHAFGEPIVVAGEERVSGAPSESERSAPSGAARWTRLAGNSSRPMTFERRNSSLERVVGQLEKFVGIGNDDPFAPERAGHRIER